MVNSDSAIFWLRFRFIPLDRYSNVDSVGNVGLFRKQCGNKAIDGWQTCPLMAANRSNNGCQCWRALAECRL